MDLVLVSKEEEADGVVIEVVRAAEALTDREVHDITSGKSGRSWSKADQHRGCQAQGSAVHCE